MVDYRIGEISGVQEVISHVGGAKYLCKCVRCKKERILTSGELFKIRNAKRCNNCRMYLIGDTVGIWKVSSYEKNGCYFCICTLCNCKQILRSEDLDKRKDFCSSCMTIKINDMFGNWRVIELKRAGYYKCKCNCGAERIISTGNLHYLKNSETCSKCKILHIGSKFDDLEVIEYIGKNGLYKCKCICGEIVLRKRTQLLNNQELNCGCKQVEKVVELLGTTIGKLTLKNTTRLEDNRVYYICDCSCGTIDNIISRQRIIQSGTWNCGCETGSFAEKQLASVFVGGQYNQRILHQQSGSPLEIDLFFPSKNIGIEYNGNYWHSDMFKEKEYHWNKTKLAEQQGIRLIHIFEYEWNTNRDILTSYLHSQIHDSEVIYGRNCNIKEISANLCRELEDANHVQGAAISSIRLALEKDNDYYGVMTFGKSRYDKSVQYELIRLTYGDTRVIGGTEKLFSYFIKKYNPESIVTYCDRAKFTGKVYEKLGFKFIEHTIPNYKWVRGNKVLGRHQTQKHILVKQGWGTEAMTENEIMLSNGYAKIHDCGNDKYIWNR